MTGRLLHGNLDALTHIVELCNNEAIPLCLVIAPYLPQHRRALVHFDEWKGRVTDAAGGMPIHDFSRGIEDASCFADPVHLNRQGAGMLLRQMIEDGMFAPLTARRGQGSDRRP